MKIAIPADGEYVSGHFAHCECFRVFELENNVIIGQSTIENLIEHEPGALPQLLNEYGINVVIADGIGHKAINLFNQQGIQVIIGVNGLIEEVIKKFISGNLTEGANSCSH